MKTPNDHTSILLRRSSFLFFRWRVFNFLPSSTLRCFDFCRLFVNASFLRFKTWHYANFNIKYGVLSMNWWIFTWISVLIYLFLRFIPVICFIWEGLESVNFVLHGATWFHQCSISSTSKIDSLRKWAYCFV